MCCPRPPSSLRRQPPRALPPPPPPVEKPRPTPAPHPPRRHRCRRLRRHRADSHARQHQQGVAQQRLGGRSWVTRVLRVPGHRQEPSAAVAAAVVVAAPRDGGLRERTRPTKLRRPRVRSRRGHATRRRPSESSACRGRAGRRRRRMKGLLFCLLCYLEMAPILLLKIIIEGVVPGCRRRPRKSGCRMWRRRR